MTYVIRSTNPATRLCEFLAQDPKTGKIDWKVATNSALKFRSPREAGKFYFSSECDSHSRSVVWVEGPRGGFHYMRRPK